MSRKVICRVFVEAGGRLIILVMWARLFESKTHGGHVDVCSKCSPTLVLNRESPLALWLKLERVAREVPSRGHGK